MQFRYDIGFLRAVAVVSVLLFHFKVEAFRGGFAGVDIFFVISGFLMTKIILGGFDRGKFSLKEFYFKRINRIIPPLLVVGFVVLVLSTILFFNQDASQNAKNILLSSVFLSNIYYWLYNGYFDSASQNNIFLHSWSLSVEWQFYIFYPLLLLPLKNWIANNRKAFCLAFIAAMSASFLLCIWVTRNHNSFAFYMFPTRAWEMMLGGVAYLFAQDIADSLSRRIRNFIVVSGYLLVLLSILLIDETVLWPSVYTIFPAVGTFLIIAFFADFGWEKWKPFQFLGNISYSLYLWHWPVWIIFRYFGLFSNVHIGIMIAISLVLATLTYYLIEQNRTTASVRFVVLTCPVVLLFSLVSFLYPDNKINKSLSLYSKESYALGNYAFKYDAEIREKQYNPKRCFITIGDAISDYDFKECLSVEKGKKNILLIGDSHAAQFSQSLREALPGDCHLLEISAGMTFPFQPAKGQASTKALVDQFYKEYLAKLSGDIDLVVFSVHWPMYRNPEIGYSLDELATGYKRFLAFFSEKGIPVLVIGQNRNYEMHFSKMAVINRTFGDRDHPDFDRYEDKITKEMYLWAKKRTPAESYIDIYDLVGFPKFAPDDTPYMVDNNHFSKWGADFVIGRIMPLIKRKIARTETSTHSDKPVAISDDTLKLTSAPR